MSRMDNGDVGLCVRLMKHSDSLQNMKVFRKKPYDETKEISLALYKAARRISELNQVIETLMVVAAQEPHDPRKAADSTDAAAGSVNPTPRPFYDLDTLARIAAESYCVGAPRWKDLSVSRQTCWHSSVHAVLEALRQERSMTNNEH